MNPFFRTSFFRMVVSGRRGGGRKCAQFCTCFRCLPTHLRVRGIAFGARRTCMCGRGPVGMRGSHLAHHGNQATEFGGQLNVSFLPVSSCLIVWQLFLTIQPLELGLLVRFLEICSGSPDERARRFRSLLSIS